MKRTFTSRRTLLMRLSTARWTTTVAAAALMALPIAASAQTSTSSPSQSQTASQQPPTQPPTQPPPQPRTQPPPTTQPPTQPPTTPPPTNPQPEAQPGQPDQTAARAHLMAAREALSQLAAMPEAAKLQGDSRTQVSQLISNFNELITTKTDW